MKISEMREEKKTDLASVEVILPSRCVDYPEPARGSFRVIPPRVREVEFLAGMNDRNYDDQLSRLLGSLIVEPRSIDPIDLTLGDRQYLHLWVRAQIDPVYRFEATCPACREVDKDFQLPISSIPLVQPPAEYRPGLRFTMPKSKHVVTMRLETARDRVRATELVAKGVPEWSARRALVITSIDEKMMVESDKVEWFRNLPGGDDMFVGEFIRWSQHGPDFSKCPFKCRRCQKESLLDLPFRLEFYMPTAHAAAAFGDAVRGCDDGARGGVPRNARDQGDGVRAVPLGAAKAS